MRDNRIFVYDKGANITLSDNFNSNEFDDDLEDESNHFTLVSPFLIVALQQIRDAVGLPVTITSGFRTAAKNKIVSTAPRSYHTTGQAADITVGHRSPEWLETLFEIITDEKVKRFNLIKGVGLYVKRNFIHIDVRETDERVTWRE